MHQEAHGDINNELYVKSLVQPHSLQKEATVITDASEKTIGGFFRKEEIQLYVSR